MNGDSVQHYFMFSITIWTLIIIIVIFYAVVILLAVWVYKDAKRRDMNAAIWVLIVLLTGFIGFIVYLIVRK